jgi:hypothetical protein
MSKFFFVRCLIGLYILCTSPFCLQADPHVLEISGGTEFERRIIHDAHQSVIDYFTREGFVTTINLVPTVIVEENIHVDGKHVPDALGLYQPESRSIHLLPITSRRFEQRRILGVGINEETYRSIVVHEFAHFVMSVLVPDLQPAIDELIASTVQLTLMDPETRSEIISLVEPIDIQGIRNVQMGLYWSNPDGFFVGAYQFCHTRRALFENIIRGRGPRIKDPLTCEL